MKSSMDSGGKALGLASRRALRFVVLVGVVSLFADMTYEGAWSVTGPFLHTLGATGVIVGLVAGFGELIGYALRLASGYIADRTARYWAVTVVGYAINMLAVPLLALAHRWEIAAAMMIAERVGKAIRTPSRDAMLSHATKEVGHGWGFGLHEAMDQAGAMIGPLVVAFALAAGWGYRGGLRRPVRAGPVSPGRPHRRVERLPTARGPRAERSRAVAPWADIPQGLLDLPGGRGPGRRRIRRLRGRSCWRCGSAWDSQ
jgi:Major Facilitator Superfamily